MSAGALIGFTRRWRPADGRPPDDELLDAYLAGRDEAAFEALVRRHGPTVLGVCRRVLRHETDAEDAFQATFLVLAKKAAAVRRREALGGWLYGVAYNVARRARDMDRRRRAGERAVTTWPTPAGPEVWQQVENVVDDELARLPGQYRAAVVACGPDGCTIAEAAARLGWRPGTVATRLARGRALLARRLARRGVAVPSALAAVASVTVPPELIAATVEAGGASARAAALAAVTLRAMARARLLVLVPLLLGAGLAGAAGVAALPAAAGDDPPPPARVAAPGTDARRATRVALAAHVRAAAIDKLPRFDYQVRYRHGVVDSLRAVEPGLDPLARGLTEPVRDEDWIGWLESGFSWDEKHFLYDSRPADTNFGHNSRFWSATEAWHRSAAKDGSNAQFVRTAGPEKLWKGLVLFHYGYLRLTPHTFRWGRTVKYGNAMTMNFLPPDKVSWKYLGVEPLGGEHCDVVDSPERAQRLWVGRETGHVRGAMTYYRRGRDRPDADRPFYKTEVVRAIAGRSFASTREFGNWQDREATDDQLVRYELAWWERYPPVANGDVEPNELIRFEDYREVARGVWLPFREVRTYPHSSEAAKGKWQISRSELVVTQVLTDRALGGRIAELRPREGEAVQDQRFAVPVNYNHRTDRTDDDVRKTADAQYQDQLKDREVLKRLLAPIEAMVGKPAPELPAEVWVGGRRPDVAGKPYLVHFWAAWCGPCKNDVPVLKRLADRGVIVVGLHPTGTVAADVQKAIAGQAMTWPTLVGTGEDGEVGGYRAGVFPYAVLVDARGRVAAHGSLHELLDKVGVEAMVPPRTGDPKP